MLGCILLGRYIFDLVTHEVWVMLLLLQNFQEAINLYLKITPIVLFWFTKSSLEQLILYLNFTVSLTQSRHQPTSFRYILIYLSVPFSEFDNYYSDLHTGSTYNITNNILVYLLFTLVSPQSILVSCTRSLLHLLLFIIYLNVPFHSPLDIY